MNINLGFPTVSGMEFIDFPTPGTFVPQEYFAESCETSKNKKEKMWNPKKQQITNALIIHES